MKTIMSIRLTRAHNINHIELRKKSSKIIVYILESNITHVKYRKHDYLLNSWTLHIRKSLRGVKYTFGDTEDTAQFLNKHKEATTLAYQYIRDIVDSTDRIEYNQDMKPIALREEFRRRQLSFENII